MCRPSAGASMRRPSALALTPRLVPWRGALAASARTCAGAAASRRHCAVAVRLLSRPTPGATRGLTPPLTVARRSQRRCRRYASAARRQRHAVVGSSRSASSAAPSPSPVAAERLRAKIGDAFARFDTINVASARCWRTPKPRAARGLSPPHTHYYRLSGSLEYAGNAANAWFTLTSVAEGKVVWSRTFERIQPPGGARH